MDKPEIMLLTAARLAVELPFNAPVVPVLITVLRSRRENTVQEPVVRLVASVEYANWELSVCPVAPSRHSSVVKLIVSEVIVPPVLFVNPAPIVEVTLFEARLPNARSVAEADPKL